uniref:Uncharacterized protein n=1 Tax=Meloidogyne enterolobii TaxID=390850 RepID=A0A6V7W2J4_MELEN|nr:unnamed protein product [Meloidogyne enterolobii]
MASAHQARYYEQSQREERGLATQQHEESLRDMEQIRHTNATLDVVGWIRCFSCSNRTSSNSNCYSHYKIPEKPGTDVQIGSSLQDLSSKLTDAADYRAERAAEHFRMQIIDPRVASHAHIPAHAIRDYARRHLIDDFPSLHGKRSFLDLEALDQLRIRPKGKLGDATDRDKDLDKFLKNRDGKPWELAHPPKVDDDSLRELDRLRNNIDNLQKARPIPRAERSVVRVSPPAPIQRREVVRREVIKAPTTKHTVHRIEEKKRTEEVERRVVRRERRHKSRRVHRGYHSSGVASGGHDYHYGSWGGRGGGWGSGGGGGYRSRSASRRSGYANGYSDGFGERHLPISYEGGGRRSGGFDSERHFAAQNGHARYGSVTDSLRRGDTKYMPNGELKINGTGTLKHHRVHKAHSTRDVYHHDEGADTGSRHSFYQHREPFIEFPPSIDRRSEWSVPPEPPSHRRHAIDEFRGGQLTKARSFADWGEEGRGRSVFWKYDEDMARLENEFRDARLMRIPSGNMYEKQHHHREIPGGYETYEREVKAHSDRKLDGGGGGGGFGTPNNGELRSRDVSQVSVKHESGLPPK